MADSLFKHKENALIGGGTALASGSLAWLLLHLRAKRRKARGLKSQSNAGQIMSAAGIGTGAGLLATALAYGKDAYNGKSLHPEEQMDKVMGANGGSPDKLTYYVAGAGSVPGSFSDVKYQYGDNVIVVNPYNDMKAAKAQIKQIAEKNPGMTLDFAGHSKGGQKAKELADYASDLGLNVGKLDTIDPIYWHSGDMNSAKHGDYTWNNFYTTKANWRYISDLWAILGGRHGDNKHADNNFAITAPMYNNHGYANDYPLIRGRELDKLELSLPNKADDPEEQWTHDIKGTIKSILGR